MTIQILGGSTSQTVDFFIQDTTKTDGSGLTGLAHNSSGLVAYYKKGATGLAVQITLVSQTEGSAWTSGGFVAVANMPGVYRLDIPNAALDSEVQTIIQLRGAANMAPVLLRVMGGKVQTNAVTVADKTGYSLSTAGVGAVADGVCDELLSGHTTPGTVGYILDSVLIAANSNRTVQVTGSNHVAASIHNAEPDSIPAGALTDAAIAEVQSGLALQSTLLLVAGYTDTEIAAIKAVTDKLDTGLSADGPVWRFTANMLELAPAGGGGGGNGDATAANQQLILDQLDVIQAKTDLLGTSQALLAGAVLTPGTITSFPEILTIGDSYTTANGRAIQIPIIDSNGNPVSEAGNLLFSDAEVTFVIKRSSDTEASRILTCNASFVDPPGTGTGDGPYALVEIPAEETSKGLVKYKYSGILKFTWPGTADEVISFETGTITFDN